MKNLLLIFALASWPLYAQVTNTVAVPAGATSATIQALGITETLTIPSGTTAVPEITTFTVPVTPPPPPPNGLTPPAQATAAGFTNLVFDEEFTSTGDIAPNGTATTGFKWYFDTWYTSLGNPTYTVTTGTTTSGAVGVLTSTAGAPIQTIPNGLVNYSTTPTGAWKHFYAECRMQASDTELSSGSGWPAYWLFGTSWFPKSPYNQTSEVDNIEFYPLSGVGKPCYACNTIHNWQHSSNGVTGSDTGNTSSENGQISLQGSSEPAQPTDSGWHTYGVLWTATGTGTGQVQFYYDNFLVVHQGGATTFKTGTGTTLPQLENEYMSIILGGAKNWPAQFDWVHVWQAP